ncbi:MAG: hypothetical protein AAFV43_01595 [Planctomycetota bacterium]
MRPPRPLPAQTLLAIAVVAILSAATAAPAWNPFARKKPAAPAQPASLSLTDQSGPWLIVATTFSGDGAEDQARSLCRELSATLRTPAYVHQMTFDFVKDGERVGRGVDKYGDPVRMKYRSGETRKEWAVLVGEYPAVDDPIARDHLARVKRMNPSALKSADGETAQNYAQIRRTQQMVLQQRGKKVTDGPMRTAFITRNPILPEEFFVPQGVDEFVTKLNKGIEHSLLDAPGRYSVKVATFKGRGQLLGATNARSSVAKRRRDKDDPLLEAGWNAHLLCEEMRDAGWEAYEFHDRNESYVAVGSFETVKSGGQPTPDVMKIVRTFGAHFAGPATPLDRGRSAVTTPKADAVRQQFNQLFTSEVGQVAGGLNPKYANVKTDARKPPRPVPFDVHPHVVEAPRRTISSRFAWRR